MDRATWLTAVAVALVSGLMPDAAHAGWSTPVALGEGVFSTVVAAAPRGGGVVVWETARTGRYRAARVLRSGRVAAGTVRFGVDSDSRVSATVGPSGDVVVWWDGQTGCGEPFSSGRPTVVVWRAGRAAASRTVLAECRELQRGAQAAVNSRGVVLAVWDPVEGGVEAFLSGRANVFRRAPFPATAARAAVQVPTVLRDGRFHVSWIEPPDTPRLSDGGPTALRVAAADARGRFGEGRTVVADLEARFHGFTRALLTDGRGGQIIFWDELDDAGTRLLRAAFRLPGGAFTGDQILMPEVLEQAIGPSGRALILGRRSETDARLRVALREPGRRFSRARFLAGARPLGAAPKAAVDGAGNAIVVWAERRKVGRRTGVPDLHIIAAVAPRDRGFKRAETIAVLRSTSNCVLQLDASRGAGALALADCDRRAPRVITFSP